MCSLRLDRKDIVYRAWPTITKSDESGAGLVIIPLEKMWTPVEVERKKERKMAVSFLW